MKTEKLITNALGFPLRLTVEVGHFKVLGTHKTFQDADTGLVGKDTAHTIRIKAEMNQAALNMAVPHEVYHLFYSVRHLITVNEETEAEAFGELVSKILSLLEKESLGIYRDALIGYARQLGIQSDSASLIDDIAAELSILNGTAGTCKSLPDYPLHQRYVP